VCSEKLLCLIFRNMRTPPPEQCSNNGGGYGDAGSPLTLAQRFRVGNLEFGCAFLFVAASNLLQLLLSVLLCPLGRHVHVYTPHVSK
jgi:hypothetical protein